MFLFAKTVWLELGGIKRKGENHENLYNYHEFMGNRVLSYGYGCWISYNLEQLQKEEREVWKMTRNPEGIILSNHHWKQIQQSEKKAGLFYQRTSRGFLSVFVWEENLIDTRLKYVWLRYVTVTRNDHFPSWDDLKEVRNIFLPTCRQVLIKFPEDNNFDVSKIHPYTLTVHGVLYKKEAVDESQDNQEDS
jgi:hypothetical protein